MTISADGFSLADGVGSAIGFSSAGSFSGSRWIVRETGESQILEWESHDGDLLAFAAPVAALGPSDDLIDLFQGCPELLAAIAGPERDIRLPSGIAPALDSWPAGLSLLLHAPAWCEPVIIRRAAFAQVGGFRGPAEPTWESKLLWDLVIRVSQCGLIKRIPQKIPMPAWSPPLLAPRAPHPLHGWILEHLRSASPNKQGSSAQEEISATALRAGLLLWHDFLDESHKCSQSIEGQGTNRLGDYWHAIMHRREPDYANAKYWFRQISPHPLFERLGPVAASILKECADPEAMRWGQRLTATDWDPFAFVDLCQQCARNEDAPLALAARRIQLAEMALLLELSSRGF